MQEAIEALVAVEYLQPSSEHPPSSPMLGFFRTLVRLSTHAWDSEPLVVDLSGNGSGISREERIAIVAEFRAVRQRGRGGEGAAVSHLNAPMYIVTSCDRPLDFGPDYLTRRSPEAPVLKMITKAAAASASRLVAWMSAADESASLSSSSSSSSSSSKDASVGLYEKLTRLRDIMSSGDVLAGCSVVFRFAKALHNANVEEGPAAASLQIFTNLPTKDLSVGTLLVREAAYAANPVQEQLFHKIRAAFGEDALFFWNGVTGRELCLVWRPRRFLPQKFQILTCKNRIAVGSGSSSSSSSSSSNEMQYTVPNVAEIISRIIGASDGLLTVAHIR